ncbi:MAG: 1-acyl-sn-glycerol-3-phosphate acyltransferase [Erysipelotrichaceae bacterium]|nr:1-acyl-sn-glycerol-3-phosphate acyltransferase [Erysipelotrichaceae bacterium]
MKRIILIVIKVLFYIPGWLLKIRYYNKHIEDTSFTERFTYIQNISHKVVSKANVDFHGFGMENLPSEQGYLLAPNHQGLFDPLIIFETLDKPYKAVVKQELLDVIVIGDCIKMLEFIGIDRENLRSQVKMIRQVSKELQAGVNYLIFPEGTRCRQKNKMLEFKGGTFKAATNAKKPIVPVAMIDCYKVFDDNSIKKVNAQVHYLEPLYYEDYKDMNTTEIAQLVQSRIQKCIEENENRYE